MSRELEKAGLPVSINKTAFLCSNSQVRKELQGHLAPGDPPIKSVAKDLGVDAAMATRRRIANHRKRFEKGKRRAARLRTLSLKSPTKALQACRAGVQAAGLYGHEAVGVPPRRMKWLRGIVAGFAGRKKLGATDIMIDFRSEKLMDPREAIMAQHFRTYHRLLVSWGDAVSPEMHQAFLHLYRNLKSVEHPWKVAKGPASAAICYLLELGWVPSSATAWGVQGEVVDITTKKGLGRLLSLLHSEINRQRWRKIAQMETDPQLGDGLDWRPHHRLLAKATPAQSNALTAVWQGAVRASNKGQAWCTRCDCEATTKHVLWDCKWWKDHVPEPDVFQRWRAEYPYPSLWTRGLMPRMQWQEETMEIVTTGLWLNGGIIDDPQILYATDGSPGAGADPRLHYHTWAVVAFRVEGDAVVSVATAAGPVQGKQSVYRSEVSALAFVVARTRGELDVTTDCKSMCSSVWRGTVPLEIADIMEPIQQERDRLQLVWVKSHLTVDQFVTQFPKLPKWRHAANQEVDALAQKMANKRRPPTAAMDLKRRDAVANRVNVLLQDRMLEMFNYDKDQGPQVEFRNQRSRQQGGSAAKGVRPNPAFAKANESTPNKRRTLEALVRGEQNKGHVWEQGSTAANMTIRCKKCGLFIQQGKNPKLFEIKLNQGCIGTAVSPPGVEVHPTHRVLNLGKEWVCTTCGLSARIAVVSASWLGEPCDGCITNKTKVARARTAKVEAAFKLCGMDPVAQRQEQRPKKVQPVASPKETQKQQRLSFGVQQPQSLGSVPLVPVGNRTTGCEQEARPAAAGPGQVGLARWLVKPAPKLPPAKGDAAQEEKAQEPGQQGKKPRPARQKGKGGAASSGGNHAAQSQGAARGSKKKATQAATGQADGGQEGGN